MVRFKNRYIAIEIVPANKGDKPLMLNTNALQYAVIQKVQKMFGDFGVASIKGGFNAKYCNTHTKIALIKSRHGPHNFVMKAIPLITDLGKQLVKVNILYIGATMRNCFSFIKKHQQQKLEETWDSLQGELEKQKMLKALSTLTPAMKDFR